MNSRPEDFSATHIVRTTSSITQACGGPWLVVSLICLVPVEILSVFFPPAEGALVHPVPSIVGALVAVVQDVAITLIGLAHLRGERLSIGEALAVAVRRWLSALVLGILRGFRILGGLLLLIVPGVRAAVHYSIALPILLEERGTEAAALVRSRERLEGRRMAAFGAYALVGLSAIPVFCLCLGPNVIAADSGLGHEAILAVASVSNLLLLTAYGIASNAPQLAAYALSRPTPA